MNQMTGLMIKMKAVIAVAGMFAYLSAFPVQASQASPDEEDSEGWGMELFQGDFPEITAEEEKEVQELIDQYLNALEMIPGEVEEKDLIRPELQLKARGEGIEYFLPDGDSFYSSVPNGMITGEPVEFRPPVHSLSMVQVNDNLAAMQGTERFTEPGSYQIRLICYHSLNEEKAGYQAYEVLFYFTILEPITSRIGVVQAPEGFIITNVRRDGKKQKQESGSWVFLQQDGSYEINYEDQKTGEIHMKTHVIRDTTAPFLDFSRKIGSKPEPLPLSFQASEPDCRIYMLYNGSSGYAVTNTLTTAGTYELRVSDTAGNSRSYLVRLKQTYKLMDYRMVGIGIAALIGIVLWMVGLRRNMRVL